MAVLNCKECGNQVSTKAKTCPKCGAKAPKEQLSPSQTILWLIMVIGILVFGIHGCANKPTPTPAEQATEDAELAIRHVAYTCGDSIKETLNDPDSAKFDYDHVNAVPKIQDKSATWIVQVPVRAKNPFNATISALFQCEVKKIGDDDWETLTVIRIE